MLTHKQIKKLVLQHKGKAVTQGKVYAGPFTIARHVEKLRRDANNDSLDALEKRAGKLQAVCDELKKDLAHAAEIIQEKESERVRSGLQTRSWEKALDTWVATYNRWKIQSALLLAVEDLIRGPQALPSNGKGGGRQRLRLVRVKELGELEHENEFLRQGEGWMLYYQGKGPFILHHRVGLSHIARLLSTPNYAVHCNELVAAPEPDAVKHENFEETEGSEQRFLVDRQDSSTTIVDEKAKSQYLKRIKDIDKELRDLDLTETIERELTEEKNAILKELDPRTESREAMSAKDRRARKAVEKAIDEAIDAIAEQSGTLAKHLRTCISKGVTPMYHPYPPVRWAVKSHPEPGAPIRLNHST